MHPINKEFFTPEDLRAQADSLRKSARSPSLLAFAAGLISQASAKERAAQRLADAQDAEESAEYLERIRAKAPPATTANPYREVRA